MIEEIKMLRGFLCDNKAHGRLHFALDELVYHLKLQQHQKPTLKEGDWVRGGFGICQVVGVTIGGKVQLSGHLEDWFGVDGMEVWAPRNGEAVWHREFKTRGIVVAMTTGVTPAVMVQVETDELREWSISLCEPFIGQS